MQIPPTCMWLAELSLVRKETSIALRRSMCPCAMRLTYPAMRRFAATLLLAVVIAVVVAGVRRG